MIELFKIIKGIYDPTWVPHFDFIHISKDTIRRLGLKVTDINLSKITNIMI